MPNQATTLFPLKNAPEFVRKIIEPALTKSDRRDFQNHGGMKLERFISLFSGKGLKNGRNFLIRKRGLYLISANVDLEHSGKKNQKVFKFGIAGTKSGSTENRLSSYLHYYGLNHPKFKHKGVMIFMFLTTSFNTAVHHTRSLIHKLERDMKQKLKSRIQALNIKDARGSERLLMTPAEARQVIQQASKNQMDEYVAPRIKTRSRTQLEREIEKDNLTEDGRLDLEKIKCLKTIKDFTFRDKGKLVTIRLGTVLKVMKWNKSTEVVDVKVDARRTKRYLLSFWDVSNPQIFRRSIKCK